MADEQKVETQASLNGTATITIPPVTVEKVLEDLQLYRANGEDSLNKINEAINKHNEQIQKLQQMKLMILGQREVFEELLRKFGPATEAAKN